MLHPDDVERINIVQDLTENKIWVCFKRPDDNNWWMSCQIWIKKGGGAEYELIGTIK